MVSREQAALYRLSEAKKQNIGYAIFCNTKEVCKKIDSYIKKGIVHATDLIITYNTNPPSLSLNHKVLSKNLDLEGIDLIYCYSLGEPDASSIDYLYNVTVKIKPTIIIQDQTAFPLKRTVDVHKYRSLIYHLDEETVIPSHFANDAYIDELLLITNQFDDQITVMDICAGQGSIGFSLLNECSKVSNLFSVEINQQQISQMGKTIILNNLPKYKIKLILSDGLEFVPKTKVELVTCNPPHFNRKAKSEKELSGCDENWNFHRKFFEQIPDFLNKGGIVTLLENNEGSNIDVFRPMIPKTLRLKELKKIKATPWYLIVLVKK